jgi:hypothetical protein
VTTAMELNDKLHAAQLDAVKTIQHLTVVAVHRMAVLRDKAPKAPKRVSQLTEPLSSQLAGHLQDWQSVATSFRERLIEAIEAPGAVTRPVAVSNGSKASSSVKKPAKKA